MAEVNIDLEDNFPDSILFSDLGEGCFFVPVKDPQVLCIKGYGDDYFVLETENPEECKDKTMMVYFVKTVDIRFTLYGGE